MSHIDQMHDDFSLMTQYLMQTADEIFSIPENVEASQDLLDQCDLEACSLASAAAHISMAAEFIVSLHNVNVITDVDLIQAHNRIDPVLPDPQLCMTQTDQPNSNGYVFKNSVQANVIAVRNRFKSMDDDMESPDETISKHSIINTLTVTSLLMDTVYERNEPDFMTRFELGSAYNLALILRTELQNVTDPVVERVYSEELSVVQEFFQANEFLAPKHGIIIPKTPFHMETAQWAWEQSNRPLSSYFPALNSGN